MTRLHLLLGGAFVLSIVNLLVRLPDENAEGVSHYPLAFGAALLLTFVLFPTRRGIDAAFMDPGTTIILKRSRVSLVTEFSAMLVLAFAGVVALGQSDSSFFLWGLAALAGTVGAIFTISRGMPQMSLTSEGMVLPGSFQTDISWDQVDSVEARTPMVTIQLRHEADWPVSYAAPAHLFPAVRANPDKKRIALMASLFGVDATALATAIHARRTAGVFGGAAT